MEVNMIELVWKQLQADLDRVRRGVASITTLSERSETTGGIEADILANAPLSADGATSGDLMFITNGRKAGEGAGVGTGVPAYFNPGTNTWKRFEDNADVTI